MQGRNHVPTGEAMKTMDWNLKKCSTLLRPCSVDRLNSLPYDLLSRILSMLPTKDAAATQILSKRMRQAFSWITSVDLDDSSICHCLKHPHLVERFPLFESFIDNVLHKLSQSVQPLTRYRLRLGGDKTTHLYALNKPHHCKGACFPNVEPARLNVWISYPLAHRGLKELDLSFHIRNPNECKLPQGLFACQSLEVLRLDSNLEFDDGAEIPLICLPNLKLLHLHSFVFTEDDFVTRLVSSCPVLEELITNCSWVKADRLIISSHSLRILILSIMKCDEEKTSDLVLIDTPNLQYLSYIDDLPYRYSVTHLNALVKARIDIGGRLLPDDTFETSFRSQLSLVRALSDVQHLSLLGTSAENVYFGGELKDQLPVFRNLKTLELGTFFNGRWDIVLLLILHRSPLLETLVFPEGLSVGRSDRPCFSVQKAVSLEAEGWRTTQTIPSCCLSNLKQIVFNSCYGIDRELNMIKFLLGKTSVLKELVLRVSKKPSVPSNVQIDRFESTVKELPRASNSCSIIVHR